MPVSVVEMSNLILSFDQRLRSTFLLVLLGEHVLDGIKIFPKLKPHTQQIHEPLSVSESYETVNEVWLYYVGPVKSVR